MRSPLSGRYAPITINGLALPPAIIDAVRCYCQGDPPHEFGLRGKLAGRERRRVRLFDLIEIAAYNGAASGDSSLLAAARSMGLDSARGIVIGQRGATDPILLDYSKGTGRPRVVCPANDDRLSRTSLRTFLMAVQFPRLAALRSSTRSGTPVEVLAAAADAGLRWIVFGT